MKFKLLLPLILVLLLNPVSGELVINKFTNEFALSSEVLDAKLCACTGKTIPVTVENVGDIAAVFTVSVISREDWFSIDEESFSLEPGQSKIVYVRADVPCKWTGTLDYDIKVTSTYGREKVLERELELVQCQNLFVDKQVVKQNVKPGELATFQFTVENKGTFEDRYNVNVNEMSEIVEISENSLMIAAGDKKTVFAYARLPAEKWGDYSIPLMVESERNGEQDNFDLTLNVKRAYNFGVEVVSEVLACSKVTTPISIEITNEADIHNHYTIETGFAMDLSEFTLAPGQTQVVTLVVNPNDDTADFNIPITVRSERGLMEAQRTVHVDVENCYDHSVTVEDVTSVCESGIMPVTITNTGMYQEDFILKVDDKDWVTLPYNEVTLGPNQFTTVDLNVNPPCSNNEYDIKVTAINKDLQVEQSDSGTLKLVTPGQAHIISVNPRNVDIKYKTEAVPITIKNEGIRDGTYVLSIDSDFLIPESEVITIGAGKEVTVNLFVSDLTDVKPGEYTHFLDFELDGSTVTYETSIGTNLIAPNPIVVFAKWLWGTLILSMWFIKIGWCGWSTMLLLAVLAAMIMIAFLLRTGRIKVKRFTADYRTNFLIINIVFIAIVLIALIYFFTSFSLNKAVFYDSPMPTDDPLMHQWPSNHKYRLDLERYFYDPDSDVLVYGHMGSSHMQVTFDDAVAVLTPDKNFEGEDIIIFTARDELGSVSESSPMTLNVLKRNDPSFAGIWLNNCSEINALIIALIFLVLLFLVDRVEPRGGQKKPPEYKPRKTVTTVPKIVIPAAAPVKKEVKKKPRKRLPPLTAAERAAGKVKRAGVKRQKGFLYFIDKEGDVARTKIVKKGEPKEPTRKIARTNVKKEDGYLYYLDKYGDVSRSKMERRKAKPKKAKKAFAKKPVKKVAAKKSAAKTAKKTAAKPKTRKKSVKKTAKKLVRKKTTKKPGSKAKRKPVRKATRRKSSKTTRKPVKRKTTKRKATKTTGRRKPTKKTTRRKPKKATAKRTAKKTKPSKRRAPVKRKPTKKKTTRRKPTKKRATRKKPAKKTAKRKPVKRKAPAKRKPVKRKTTRKPAKVTRKTKTKKRTRGRTTTTTRRTKTTTKRRR